MKLSLYSTLYLSIAVVKATLPRLPQRPLKTHVETNSFFDADFDAFVKETLEEWHVPGLSIAIVDGESVYSKVLLSLSSFDATMLNKLPGLRLLPPTRCGGHS